MRTVKLPIINFLRMKVHIMSDSENNNEVKHLSQKIEQTYNLHFNCCFTSEVHLELEDKEIQFLLSYLDSKIIKISRYIECEKSPSYKGILEKQRNEFIYSKECIGNLLIDVPS